MVTWRKQDSNLEQVSQTTGYLYQYRILLTRIRRMSEPLTIVDREDSQENLRWIV